MSLFFYVADEAGAALKIFPGLDNGKFAGGTSLEIGGWELHVKGQVYQLELLITSICRRYNQNFHAFFKLHLVYAAVKKLVNQYQAAVI